MKTIGKTVNEILANVPGDRIEPFNKLHQVIVKNLPKGFEAAISYGGLGYVVPHKLYPAGYHCKPDEPLPFAGIASQKNSINFFILRKISKILFVYHNKLFLAKICIIMQITKIF